jgi:hypothetical protein
VNEAKFGRLLRKLRGRIYIPKEMDPEFEHHLRNALDDYAEEYDRTMREEITAQAESSTSKARKVGEGFVVAAASAVGLTALAVHAGNPVDKVVSKIAEETLSRTLPSGFTLSERIWDLRYERDILSIVQNANNLSPEMLAKQLDGFILPGREVTTLTPYGRSLNFDSMRLARTEVTRAGREASKEVLNNTPWVTGLMWDGSGGCEEICLPLDGNVYTSESDLPDTHAQCNCQVIEQVMTSEEWTSALDEYTTNGTDEIGIGSWLAD